MTIATREKCQNISSCMPFYTGNEKIDEVATRIVLGVTKLVIICLGQIT